MSLRAAILVGSALALSGPVSAQPAGPFCYGLSPSGYAGPSTVLGCNCSCNCTGPITGLDFEVATLPGSFAPPVLSGHGNNGFYGRPLGADTLMPGVQYQMRVRLSDAVDAGDWGPGNPDDAGPNCMISDVPYAFIYDDKPPGVPGVVSVTLDEQQVNVAYSPADDFDGGGIDFYAICYGGYICNYTGGFGMGRVSPVTETLPPGNYDVTLLAQDLAQNLGPQSPSFPITVGFDASVPVPPAPSWPFPATNNGYVDSAWPSTAGESYGYEVSGDGGPWGPAQHVQNGGAHMGLLGPCTVNRYRIARIIGRASSDWSTPSPPMLLDHVAPNAGAAPALSASPAAVRIQWVDPGDGCDSGMSYDVERSLGGGAWHAVASALAAATFDDAPDAAGTFAYRFIAVDGAGNRTASAQASIAFPGDAGLPPIDAGLPRDAGSKPDAGPPPDAGPTADGGAGPEPLRVGCGCDGAASSAALLLGLLALARRRSSAS
jgi:hypothetical protein